jgi:hypothetical protein
MILEDWVDDADYLQDQDAPKSKQESEIHDAETLSMGAFERERASHYRRPRISTWDINFWHSTFVHGLLSEAHGV